MKSSPLIIKSLSLTDSSNKTDTIYQSPQSTLGDFVFDASVANVFPDMIQRSVPGYAAIINMIAILTELHAQPNTHLYDLGCSLGASANAMANGLGDKDCRIIAVDNSQAMLDKATANSSLNASRIRFELGDIREVDIQNASLVVLNFTLQFLPREERAELLGKIAKGLQPGGILILSEKIQAETPEEDERLIEMHQAFKRSQGYSELEVSQKRSALENVLLPEKLSTHTQRLKDVGFTSVDCWFQCFNFVSMVARV